jgi:hypothetical protein
LAQGLRGACFSGTMRTWSIGSILLIIAVICFALAAIGLDVNVSLVALGLAFLAASFLAGEFRGLPRP